MLNLVYIDKIQNPNRNIVAFNLDSQSSRKKLAEFIFDFYLTPATLKREEDPRYLDILLGNIEQVDRELREKLSQRFYPIKMIE